MRSKSKRDDQLNLRVAGKLRAALEDEAATESLGLSTLVRKILIDHAAARNVSRVAAANQGHRADG